MIPRKQKVRIGDMLVGKGEISKDQLDEALADQKRSSRKLGRILIDKGFIEENRFLKFLSEQFEIPFVTLHDFRIDPQLVARLPETYARRYRAIVLGEENGEMVVGMADPMDIFAYDEVSRYLAQPVTMARWDLKAIRECRESRAQMARWDLKANRESRAQMARWDLKANRECKAIKDHKVNKGHWESKVNREWQEQQVLMDQKVLKVDRDL